MNMNFTTHIFCGDITTANLNPFSAGIRIKTELVAVGRIAPAFTTAEKELSLDPFRGQRD